MSAPETPEEKCARLEAELAEAREKIAVLERALEEEQSIDHNDPESY